MYNHAGGQIYDRKGAQPPKAQHTGQNNPAKPISSAQRPLVQTQLRVGKFFFFFAINSQLLLKNVHQKCTVVSNR